MKAVACTRGAQGRWRTCVILLSRPRGSRYRKWHPGSFLVNIRHDSLCSVYRLLYKEEFLFLEEKKEFSFSERKRRERNCERKMKKYHCITFLHILVNRIIFFFSFYWSNTYLIFKKLENVVIILKAFHYLNYCIKISTILNIYIFSKFHFSYCNIFLMSFIKIEFKNRTLKLRRK